MGNKYVIQPRGAARGRMGEVGTEPWALGIDSIQGMTRYDRRQWVHCCSKINVEVATYQKQVGGGGVLCEEVGEELKACSGQVWRVRRKV